mmetsp:Transcript_36808/g.96835  ORF Transcript_36808/g.96835 Transcript_36808/m.96835 type:complete len:219 (+) Transcript_36808:1793-2449(+)
MGPVVGLLAHQTHHDVGRAPRVGRRLAPPFEGRLDEITQQRTPLRVGHARVRCEEHLRVTEASAAQALERHKSRRRAEVVLELERLHHVVYLDCVHLAVGKEAHLLGAADADDVGVRHQPLHQPDLVFVHADADRPVTQPRRAAGQGGERERRRAKHGRNRLHRRTSALCRNQDVLPAGGDQAPQATSARRLAAVSGAMCCSPVVRRPFAAVTRSSRR